MTEQLLKPTVSVRSVLLGPRQNILVLQRATDNEWELPGGRLSPFESVSEGLHREVHEETSLSMEIEDILLANSWLNDQNNDRFGVYYVCQTSQKTVDLSEEHTDSRWLAPTEATSLLPVPQATAVRRSCEEHNEKPIVEI